MKKPNKLEQRDIAGYEGRYAVTRDGRIWAYPKTWKNFRGTQIRLEGRWLKLPIQIRGYYNVTLWKNNKNIQYVVHRVVAQAFIPNPENKAFVNHKDGNKLNNHVSNLEWCTMKENAIHAYKNGLNRPPKSGKGILNGSSKLVDQDIRDIRMFSSRGISKEDMTKVYPVCAKHIYEILRGNRWSHIL